MFRRVIEAITGKKRAVEHPRVPTWELPPLYHSKREQPSDRYPFTDWASQKVESIYEGATFLGPSPGTGNHLGETITIETWLERNPTIPNQLDLRMPIQPSYTPPLEKAPPPRRLIFAGLPAPPEIKTYSGFYQQEYLRSPYWKELSFRLREAANWTCEVCEKKTPRHQLHVHHFKGGYTRLGHERATDLLVVCETCHEQFHPEKQGF